MVNSSPYSPSRLAAAQEFLRAYPYYIRIDVACREFSDEHPHRFLECLHDEVQAFMLEAANPDVCTLYLWTDLFVFSGQESVYSASFKQDRGTFLVGVEPHSGGKDLGENDLAGPLQTLEGAIKTKPQYLDEQPPPFVLVNCVKRSRLGRLILDQWIWPRPANPPLFIAKEREADVASCEVQSVESQVVVDSRAEYLRPALDVINRLKHDGQFDISDYLVVYEDRHSGYQEKPVVEWKRDTTEETFIPQHRIVSFRRRSTGEIVWSREKRFDKFMDQLKVC